MLCFPNCKINLGLYITGRREDGYHNLETIFYPVTLRDALEIVPAVAEGRFELFGKAIDGDSRQNLVWKAVELVKARYPDKVPGLDIYLHKVIPMGAGLGGGSADAGFMLKLLNDFCRLEMDGPLMEELALRLGSDCPFFIRNTPQLASGRGEIMEPVSVDLTGFSIQLICPKVHISTAKAFSMISARSAPVDLRKLSEMAVVDWKDQVSNDFEEPAFKEFPELKQIKRQLYNQGAVYASMSGSGSAIYGLFHKGGRAKVESEVAFEEYYITDGESRR